MPRSDSAEPSQAPGIQPWLTHAATRAGRPARLAVALSVGIAVLLLVTAAAEAACPSMEVVGVRGSGQTQGFGSPVEQVVAQINLQTSRAHMPADFKAIDYRAIDVNWWKPNYYVHSRGSYKDSVKTGYAALLAYIKYYVHHNPCGGTTYVYLAGYSQGAQVVADVYQNQQYNQSSSPAHRLTKAEKSRIKGVVLFGDPRFNGRQRGSVNAGTFRADRYGIDNFVLGFYAPRRVFGSDGENVQSYCADGDPVCNYTSRGAVSCGVHNDCAHYHYNDRAIARSGITYTDAAASFLIARWHRFGPRPVRATVFSRQNPVTDQGAIAPGFTVTNTWPTGMCEEGSDIGQAYRCFTGHHVLDPCYAVADPSTGDGTGVVCLTSPFSNDLNAITYATGLGALVADSYDEPYGLVLGDGAHCTLAQGAHSADTAGRVIDYYCDAKHSNTVVLRGLHKTGDHWTADVARPGSNYTHVAWGSQSISAAILKQHDVPPANRSVTNAGNATTDELDLPSRRHHEVDCGSENTVATSSTSEQIFESGTHCYEANLILTEWDNNESLEIGWSCTYDTNGTLLCQQASSVNASDAPAFFTSPHIRAFATG
jgi:hypothetical protein